MNRIFTKKVVDLRPIDFYTGKRIALADSEKHICQCCGKKIAKVAHLNTGHEVGTDCAQSLEWLSQYSNASLESAEKFCVNKTQYNFFASLSGSGA